MLNVASMVRPCLTKGLFLIAAAVSLSSSESQDNHTLTDKNEAKNSKPLTLNCDVNKTSNIILDHGYNDAATWKCNILFNSTCRISFLKLNLRMGQKRCLDKVTFTFRYQKEVTFQCRSLTQTPYKIPVSNNETMVTVTVQTGEDSLFGWLNTVWLSPLPWDDIRRKGFILTFHGMPRSHQASLQPTPNYDTVGTEITNSPETDDDSKNDTELQDDRLDDIFENISKNWTSIIYGNASVDCNKNLVITTNDDTKRAQALLDSTRTSGSECIVVPTIENSEDSRGTTIQLVGNRSIVYLNETQALAIYKQDRIVLLLSCAAGSGSWAKFSCQGFREEHLYNEVLTERSNLIPAVLSATLGVLAVTIVAAVIWLVVRRKSLSTKTATVHGTDEQAYCSIINPNVHRTEEHPYATFTLQDNHRGL